VRWGCGRGGGNQAKLMRAAVRLVNTWILQLGLHVVFIKIDSKFKLIITLWYETLM